MPILSVDDLSLAFAVPGGRVSALDRASFEVGRGRTVALVGESGSGKSALAQAVMGLLPGNARIEGGALRFDDRGRTVDLAALPASSPAWRSLRGGRIGLVFQEPLSAFSPVHTAGFQVAEAVRAHSGASRAEARARVLALFERVGLPDPARAFDAYPHELSGGMRQRAMIAAALAGEPDLLIADEPTTALDVTIQAQVLALLDRLKRDLGLSLLFITHDLGVVAGLADDVVALHRGRVVERGPAREVFKASRHPYFASLLAANPALGARAGRLATIAGEATGATAYAAGSTRRADVRDKAGDPLLVLDRVTKRFAPRRGAPAETAVAGVSLTIARGESVGLVGESGSGKTTLARLAMRALAPDDGAVYFVRRGRAADLKRLEGSELARYRRRVAYVFQDPYAALNPRMTVRETLAEPFVIHRLGGRRAREERARELLDLVRLPSSALDRHPPSFSGGQRQRIAIARALALRPELIVLDEPTSALDVSVQAQILNLLADIRAGLGVAFLFVSHDLAVVNHIAERVCVMRRGRIVEDGPREAVFGAPAHPYTQALVAAAPEADPDRPLDLTLARAFQDPATWGPHFRVEGDERAVYSEVAGQPAHRVLVRG